MMKRASKVSRIENITFQFGIRLLINKPTHILQNYFSCVYVIFTLESNILVESGGHPSLHPNCHHQIAFAKFNLKVYYPPAFLRAL